MVRAGAVFGDEKSNGNTISYRRMDLTLSVLQIEGKTSFCFSS